MELIGMPDSPLTPEIVPPQVDRPEPGPATAELILVAAADLFRRKGYAEATTRELGNAVGIRGASVYYHYKTKEDILYGLCQESLRRLTARVAPLADLGDSVEDLRAVIQAHVVTILHDRDMHTTMLVEMRSLSPERRQHVIERRDAYEGLIRGVIARAQAAGGLRGDLSPRELTRALLSMLNWTIFWYRDDGEMSVEAVAALLASVFLEGVVVRAAHDT
jgi:AcrR family transcriptional regulator